MCVTDVNIYLEEYHLAVDEFFKHKRFINVYIYKLL